LLRSSPRLDCKHATGRLSTELCRNELRLYLWPQVADDALIVCYPVALSTPCNPTDRQISDEIQSGERAGKPPVPFFLCSFIHKVLLSKMPLSPCPNAKRLRQVAARVVFVLQESCPLNRTAIRNQQSSCNTEILNVHRQLVDRSGFCLNSPRRP